MARMYSRKKGKAKSRKPTLKADPSWVRYKEKEIEILISKTAKEGKSSSEIGIALRDKYGIPSAKAITKKKIAQMLKEKKLNKSVPEDLLALLKRSVALNKHITTNNQDKTAKRGLTLTESKIRRLTNYYKREGSLQSEWKYSRETASMLVD